jgi:hypothetical protein
VSTDIVILTGAAPAPRRGWSGWMRQSHVAFRQVWLGARCGRWSSAQPSPVGADLRQQFDQASRDALAVRRAPTPGSRYCSDVAINTVGGYTVYKDTSS